ncbi:hypothetical protein [Pasteuria penetrans]|uniref:hypothetical protein n=1 Tax=Pasteuria penetrans TaxID=86005 RepID=UPI000FAFCFD9|nr:hypothetical protein [Pasteuria penetrans]
MKKMSRVYGKLPKVVACLSLSITSLSFVPNASAEPEPDYYVAPPALGVKDFRKIGDGVVKGIEWLGRLEIVDNTAEKIRNCSWCPWN